MDSQELFRPEAWCYDVYADAVVVFDGEAWCYGLIAPGWVSVAHKSAPNQHDQFVQAEDLDCWQDEGMGLSFDEAFERDIIVIGEPLLGQLLSVVQENVRVGRAALVRGQPPLFDSPAAMTIRRFYGPFGTFGERDVSLYLVSTYSSSD